MVKDLPPPVEKRCEITLRCNDKEKLLQGKEWYKEEFGSHFSVGEKLQDFSSVNLNVCLQKRVKLYEAFWK
jgi:hypothetical protein